MYHSIELGKRSRCTLWQACLMVMLQRNFSKPQSVLEFKLVINPRRMREGYGTQFVIHSVCPTSCRDHRTLLKLGKGMNRLSTTMACNVTRGFC